MIAPPLELWGGVECTLNRVGDTFFDQLGRSGHAVREGDLALFASLGFRALRYPILWERIAPNGYTNIDWSWADARLERLRALGLKPIIGLTHHGSGPRSTSLADPSFATGLAEFAGRVAERYPWLEYFTPVNEPLTTARFSGLYGHWYPHGRSTETFAQCLVNQCLGVVRSMRRIRAIVPHARLVQTEDLGRIYSTPRLAYQAEFENERRWLSFDLLCGKLDRAHVMWPSLVSSGISEAVLDEFLADPCPPDIFGINHYVTSNRYLDEDMQRYPAWLHGGNGRERYADSEAVRARLDLPVGIGPVLREAWERYGKPLAVTEAQISGTREEQMRWLRQTWSTCEQLRQAGLDIRAVTVWSLLGAFDWNTLVTADRGFYESGAFDVRAPSPRATGVARLAHKLATGGAPDEPAIEEPGWWQRDDRLFPTIPRPETAPLKQKGSGDAPRRPLLIAGGGGTIGAALARVCEIRGLPYVVATRADLDITNPDTVGRMLVESRAWAVVNAAGYRSVESAERDREACFLANTVGPAVLADGCARRGIRLVTFSSDLVFDGQKRAPYVESDASGPLSVYGRSQAEAERRVLAILPEALIIRTSTLFGPWDQVNFLTRVLRALSRGRRIRPASDGTVSPTYVVDLAHVALDFLMDRERGVWHLVNDGVVTWAELVRRVAEIAGVRSGSIEPRPTSELTIGAPRPRYGALESERGWPMTNLDSALVRYVAEAAWKG